MNWKDHLKPEEVTRLSELRDQTDLAKLERRRIYDRCRKRMKGANGESDC